MTSILVLRLVFTILFMLTSFLDFPSAECKNIGFTTNLIRRNYPQKSLSPSNDVLSSKSEYFEWIAKSVNRSFSRAAYFNHVNTKQSAASRIIDSPLNVLDGAYAMEVGIGTPPVTIHLIVDTTKELTWTQCKPCNDCYNQKDPMFDTNKTLTYQQLSCKSQQCQALATAFCDESSKCRYKLGNGLFTRSRCDLAVETFTIGSNDGNNVSFPNMAFGCGHHISAVASGRWDTSGIIGLNRGPLSIVNQLSPTISKKFSYCLVPIHTSSKSKISFGVDPFPPGSKVVSTPLVKRPENFYFITLEGISVGKGNDSENHRIDTFKSRRSASIPYYYEGNIIIDSDITFNLLPKEIYQDLISKLLVTIKAQPIKGGIGTGSYDLCYKKDPKLEFPDLVFHFTGADVVIPPENSFMEYTEGVTCLMSASAGNGFATFGNLAQTNYLIEYDLDNEKISFLPTDCSKEH